MSTITADVEVEFVMSYRARLSMAWACLLGRHVRLLLPESTVTLREEAKK